MNLKLKLVVFKYILLETMSILLKIFVDRPRKKKL